jgi:hypothetical protein
MISFMQKFLGSPGPRRATLTDHKLDGFLPRVLFSPPFVIPIRAVRPFPIPPRGTANACTSAHHTRLVRKCMRYLMRRVVAFPGAFIQPPRGARSCRRLLPRPLDHAGQAHHEDHCCWGILLVLSEMGVPLYDCRTWRGSGYSDGMGSRIQVWERQATGK